MRNNYSDIAFGYPSNSVTDLMKIKASSTNISKKVYQNLAYFMNCFFNKQFMKLILSTNFCNKQFMKSQLLYNNFNLLTNKMSLQFCILIEQIIVIASNGVYRIKMPFKTTLPSLHIANLKGSNRYADWFP